jgi:hypothetical protein
LYEARFLIFVLALGFFATGARGAEFKLNLPLGLQKSAAKLLTTIR